MVGAAQQLPEVERSAGVVRVGGLEVAAVGIARGRLEYFAELVRSLVADRAGARDRLAGHVELGRAAPLPPALDFDDDLGLVRLREAAPGGRVVLLVGEPIVDLVRPALLLSGRRFLLWMLRLRLRLMRVMMLIAERGLAVARGCVRENEE